MLDGIVSSPPWTLPTAHGTCVSKNRKVMGRLCRPALNKTFLTSSRHSVMP